MTFVVEPVRDRLVAALSLIAIFAASPVLAVQADNPSTVCNYLKEVGLAAGSWKDMGSGEFGCLSPYKELGQGFSLANDIAFYVDGDQHTVTRAYLVLNVNSPTSAKPALTELLRAADLLAAKTVGKPLPQSIRNAIDTGKDMTAKIGTKLIIVSRQNFRSGRGYEIHVEIQD